MRCPDCDSERTGVRYTSHEEKEGEAYIRRRRVCHSCGFRFNTFECYERADLEAAFRIQEALGLINQAKQKLSGKP